MAVNSSIRTVVLSMRLSPITLTPFTYSGAVFSLPHGAVQKSGQKRHATTLSSSRNGLLPSGVPPRPGLSRLNDFRHQDLSQTPACVRRNSTASTSIADRKLTPASPSGPDTSVLDWNTFFKLRASRRRYSLVSSILTSIMSTATGIQVLSTQDLESLGTQVMGLDPFVVLGLATATCGAAGWLAGPFLGNALWGLSHRRFRGAVAVKEKAFYNRIKRFRVDPSTNSISNPVPDYYGEKVSSVQGYRQWLKDQRAYNRKRRNFIQ